MLLQTKSHEILYHDDDNQTKTNNKNNDDDDDDDDWCQLIMSRVAANEVVFTLSTQHRFTWAGRFIWEFVHIHTHLHRKWAPLQDGRTSGNYTWLISIIILFRLALWCSNSVLACPRLSLDWGVSSGCWTKMKYECHVRNVELVNFTCFGVLLLLLIASCFLYWFIIIIIIFFIIVIIFFVVVVIIVWTVIFAVEVSIGRPRTVVILWMLWLQQNMFVMGLAGRKYLRNWWRSNSQK